MVLTGYKLLGKCFLAFLEDHPEGHSNAFSYLNTTPLSSESTQHPSQDDAGMYKQQNEERKKQKYSQNHWINSTLKPVPHVVPVI